MKQKKQENIDWYKNAKLTEIVICEAALRNYIPIGLASALVAVFLGSGIQNAARQHNVSEQEIQNALANKDIVQQVQQNMQQPQQPSKPQQEQTIQQPNKSQQQFSFPEDARPWTGIIVHHSDSPEWTTVEDIDKWHKERTYVDKNGVTKHWKGIGYHFVIYTDGSVHPGRPLTEIGSHAKGRNTENIGICLVGKEKFTPEQFKSLQNLISQINNNFNISSVQRHHEQCPGKSVNVETLNQMVQEKQDKNDSPVTQ